MAYHRRVEAVKEAAIASWAAAWATAFAAGDTCQVVVVGRASASTTAAAAACTALEVLVGT